MDFPEHIPLEFDEDSSGISEDGFDDDLDFEPSTSQTSEEKRDDRKERGSIRNITKLTPQFKGLMGEANLRFARGDTETAQQMCFEVIRQVPNAWEPYLTLAQIYEADPKKYKSYLTIASYLNPSNGTTWCRLAEMSIEEGNQREALTFYSKCLNYNKKNIEVHMKRIELAKALGDEHLVLKFQKFLITKLPEERYEEIIEIASRITKIYHKQKKYEKALNVLQVPFQKIPQHITLDLVNMMLELLLLTNQYAQCLDIFVDFCNFNFELVVQPDESIKINDYSMPDDISIDLKTKFIVCAVKLKCFDVAEKLIDVILEAEDVETVGDLYLDICEALMVENKHNIALKLFIPLKKSKNYSLAGVWLKFSECLEACGMKEQAIDGYYTVITLAPQHIEVLHPLAKLLLEMNKKDEALNVMAYQTTDRLNVGVLIMRSKILRQIGDLNEYWKCMELLLSRHCAVFKHQSEIQVIVTNTKQGDRILKIQKLREFRNDNSEIIPNLNMACIMEPDNETEYELLKEALNFAMENKDYRQMEKLAFMASTSKKFEKYSDEILLHTLLACLYNGDLQNGYYFARDAVIKYPNNNLIWNLFNLFTVYGDQRPTKFIARFHSKIAENEACEILEANSEFYFCNYTSAMKFFIKEFKEYKSPYTSFILGVLTLHMSTVTKQVAEDIKKQLSETTTYLFLYYSKIRSKMASQEVFFNLGRMYHQLGIMYLAEHYYRSVFDVENELLEEHPETLDLKPEAAYNLHLIYKKSGNMDAARNVLLKYCVV